MIQRGQAPFVQGDYMMDLAHLYKMMVQDSVIPQVQDLTHMTRQQMIDFIKRRVAEDLS